MSHEEANRSEGMVVELDAAVEVDGVRAAQKSPLLVLAGRRVAPG